MAIAGAQGTVRMLAESSWPGLHMQKQVGTSMLVTNSQVKRRGGLAIGWSRDRAEDTEVPAEICPQHGSWLA